MIGRSDPVATMITLSCGETKRPKRNYSGSCKKEVGEAWSAHRRYAALTLGNYKCIQRFALFAGIRNSEYTAYEKIELRPIRRAKMNRESRDA